MLGIVDARPSRVELLTGIEGASSRLVRRIMLIDARRSPGRRREAASSMTKTLFEIVAAKLARLAGRVRRTLRAPEPTLAAHAAD